MSSRPELKLAWCDHKAAKYAVEHWHYSCRMPFGKTVRVGVWENGQFIGCVLFGYSATPTVAKGAGLPQTEIAELTRIALRDHQTPVSRIVAIAVKLLRQENPGLRLIVSFADADEDRHGGIYQAGNWVYTGLSMQGQKNGYIVHGRFIHCRTADQKGRNTLDWVQQNLDSNATVHLTKGKHRYLMPLDDAMRQTIAPLAKPYPKRVRSDTSDTPGLPAGKGRGSTDPDA